MMKLEIVKTAIDYLLLPGQAYIFGFREEVNGPEKKCLQICCPKCSKTAGTYDHTLTFEQDGTVTLEPSLQCPHCNYHYFVKKGEIVE